MILTTTIGSYPKPEFLKLPDWFQGDKGTDTERPTADWKNAMDALGNASAKTAARACEDNRAHRLRSSKR